MTEGKGFMKGDGSRHARVSWLSALSAIVLAGGALLWMLLIRDSEIRAANMEELEAAIQHAKPGDTIVMKNGVWEDVLIRINGAHGTEEKPITLRAETRGQVQLTGTSRLRIGSDYWIVDGLVFRDGGLDSERLGDVIEFRDGPDRPAHHSRLTNTQILYYNPPEEALKEQQAEDIPYKWVSIFGQHNRVDHSHFEGKTNGESLLAVWRHQENGEYADGDFHLIDHNYFANVPELGANGLEAIRIGTSHDSRTDSFTIIEHNLFERYDGEAELISVKTGRNTIRFNTVFDSSAGITLRHGDNSEVYGNFILGNHKVGMGIRAAGAGHRIYNNYLSDIAGTDASWRAALTFMNGDEQFNEDEASGPLILHTYKQVQDVEISSNTLVNNRHNIHVGAGSYTLPPKNMSFANNLIYSTHNRLFHYLKEPAAVRFENNIAFGNYLGFSPLPEGVVQEDPEVSLGEDGLYRSLLAENKGVGSTLIADGHRPLTRADVGPDWLDPGVFYAGDLAHHFTEAEHYRSAAGEFAKQVCEICSNKMMIKPGNAGEGLQLVYAADILSPGEYYVQVRSHPGNAGSGQLIRIKFENGVERTFAGSTRGWQWTTHEEPIVLPKGLVQFTVSASVDLDRLAVSRVREMPR